MPSSLPRSSQNRLLFWSLPCAANCLPCLAGDSLLTIELSRPAHPLCQTTCHSRLGLLTTRPLNEICHEASPYPVTQIKCSPTNRLTKFLSVWFLPPQVVLCLIRRTPRNFSDKKFPQGAKIPSSGTQGSGVSHLLKASRVQAAFAKCCIEVRTQHKNCICGDGQIYFSSQCEKWSAQYTRVFGAYLIFKNLPAESY